MFVHVRGAQLHDLILLRFYVPVPPRGCVSPTVSHGDLPHLKGDVWEDVIQMCR